MMRSTCTRWVHIAITCLSGFLLGYDLCVIGSVLTPVQRDLRLCFPCADTSDAALAHCTCAAKELVVSSVSLGAIAGGLLGGFLADRLGRRAALALTDVLFVVGAVGLAAAEPSLVSLFFIGRVLLCGLALGAAGAVASVYLAEISPPHERGLVITLNEVAVCVGCLSAYLSSLALADSRWRWTDGIACAPALLQLAGVGLLFEESPRWLVERGLLQQGGNAAARLGIGISPLLQLQTHSSGETTEGRSWATELRLKLRAHRTPLALAAGCAMAHAASAANTVLYYSRDILQAAGVTAPLAANVSVGATKLFAVLVCIATVDRIGRRRLLLIGTAGMATCHAGLAVAFSEGAVDGGGMSGFALLCLLLFILSWNVSWAGLMLTVAAELLPQPVRGFGLGAAYALYWALSFVQSQTLETLFATIGHTATFVIYAGTSCLAFGFTWHCVPETRGTSLEAVGVASTADAPADASHSYEDSSKGTSTTLGACHGSCNANGVVSTEQGMGHGGEPATA